MPLHPPVSNPRIKDAELEAEGALLARFKDEPKDPVMAPEIVSLAALRTGSVRAKLRRNRVRKPGLVLHAARSHDLPVALLCALLEQETGIPQHNIFGCDWGSGYAGRPPWCHDRVTNPRVRKLQRSGKANGVGWTQLTYPTFVTQAMHMKGGAADPKNQLRVGCNVLREDIRIAGSVWGGLERYNGSAAYANEVLARYHRWHDRLT